MAKKKKRIYLDFNDWWSNGNHGWSSTGKEDAKEIWDDLEPTINAKRDDYENTFIALCNEMKAWRPQVTKALLDYVEKFKKDDAPKFWAWYYDQVMKGKRK